MDSITLITTKEGTIVLVKKNAQKDVINELKAILSGGDKVGIKLRDLMIINQYSLIPAILPILASVDIGLFEVTCNVDGFFSKLINDTANVKFNTLNIFIVNNYQDAMSKLSNAKTYSKILKMTKIKSISDASINHYMYENQIQVEENEDESSKVPIKGEKKHQTCPTIPVIINNNQQVTASFSENFLNSLFFKTCDYIVNKSDMVDSSTEGFCNGVVSVIFNHSEKIRELHLLPKFSGKQESNSLISVISTKLSTEHNNYFVKVKNGSNYIVITKKGNTNMEGNSGKGKKRTCKPPDSLPIITKKMGNLDIQSDTFAKLEELNKPVTLSSGLQHTKKLEQALEDSDIKSSPTASASIIPVSFMEEEFISVMSSEIIDNEIINGTSRGYASTPIFTKVFNDHQTCQGIQTLIDKTQECCDYNTLSAHGIPMHFSRKTCENIRCQIALKEMINDDESKIYEGMSEFEREILRATLVHE